MKCIHCGSDSKYKDRTAGGGKCPTCHHHFAFEPKTDPLSVSDGLFKKCIQDVSEQGTVQFTERQLYYEFARKTLRRSLHIPQPYGWASAGMVVAGGIGAAAGFAIVAIPLAVVSVVGTWIAGAAAGKKTPHGRVPRVPPAEFRSGYVARWTHVHGAIPGLLAEPARKKVLHTSEAPGGPPDLGAYSFDRALVVDRADVAAMLVANRFHFENNCAVLSLDQRFPANGRFTMVRDMLRRNPRLIVFALHDASADGMATAAALRGEEWFPDPAIRIADIGLRPRHVLNSSLSLEKRDQPEIPDELRALLDPKEIAWLREGYCARLEAMRPAKLMRAIYQAFSRMVTVGPDGTYILVDSGPGIWVGDGYGADTGVYAADSFG